MKIFFKYFVIVILCLLVSNPYSGATAQDKTISLEKFNDLCGVKCKTTPPQGQKCDPKDIEIDKSIVKPGKITGNVVRCMERVINAGGDTLIRNFGQNFSKLVYYGIMFAVLIWAARMMFGIGKSRGVISIMMLKLAFVMYICSPGMYVQNPLTPLEKPQMMKWRDGLIDFPKRYSVSILNGVKQVASCEGGITGGTGVCGAIPFIPPVTGVGLATPDIFDEYDEYILDFFGVVKRDATKAEKDEAYKKMKEENVYIGIAVLIGGLFFTGDVGNSITMVGVMFIMAILVAAMQSVLIFTTITIAINFLLALAPLMVTCILFDPLKKITLSWFYAILAYAIQPIILTTFLAITLGLLSSIMDSKYTKPDGTHEAIIPDVYKNMKIKVLEQADGSKGTEEYTVLNCDKLKQAAGAVTKGFTSGSAITQAASASLVSRSGMNSAISGGMNNDAIAGLTDQLQTGIAQSCSMLATQIKIDSGDVTSQNAVDPSQQLTEESFQQLTGTQLAVVMLLVMLISFLKKVPELAEKLTSQGSVASLTHVAGDIGGKLQKATIGSNGGGGALGQIRGMVNRGF